MKKIVIILCMTICLCLCACGKANMSSIKSDNDFTKLLGEDFSWEMTQEEAIEYIKAHTSETRTVKVPDKETVTDYRTYTMYFEEDNNLKLTCVIFKPSYESMPYLTKMYGEPEASGKMINRWYGTLAGRETVVSTITGDNSIQFNLAEFVKK